MMDNKMCKKETKGWEITESHTAWLMKYLTFMRKLTQFENSNNSFKVP